MIDTHALGWDECERLVQWFTHRMSMETRRELMADLPQLYVKLHPGVDTAAVVDAVRGKIARTEGERLAKLATELDREVPLTRCAEHAMTGPEHDGCRR